MARTGLWRLNSQGVSALQSKYRQGRWGNVAAFCHAAGIPRSTYYYLIKRDRWYEPATLLDKITAFGIPESSFAQICEFRHDGPEAVAEAPILPCTLPRSLTSFIGRETAIAEIRALLQSSPLITLTGAGGSGKTRLAVQIAQELNGEYEDGGWLVELASLSDPDLVPQAAATVFGIREQFGTPLLVTLARTLSSRRLLLVLDNCEHLLDAAAALASALLQSCPEIRVIATSRQRLSITGEQNYIVPSLEQTDPYLPVTVANIENVESVRLFVERARLYRPSFALNDRNAASVASLCNRLDGIPLALELAAAQVRSLSVQDILERLEDPGDLVTGEDRSAMPRQKTLRAVIDWSYALLSPEEKVLLQRLSVFPGGWSLSAVRSLYSDEPLGQGDVVDLLTLLIDKSLVLVEERNETVRYRMYDTLRYYAAEKLAASGESDIVIIRRQNWLLEFARQATDGIRLGEDHEKCMLQLEMEHDNLRAALAWDGRDASSGQTGMLLAAALWRFWMIRGYSREGSEHLRRSLARDSAQGRTTARSLALSAAGNLANNLGDYAAAIELYLEDISICKESAECSGAWTDRAQVAALLLWTAEVALTKEDVQLARELLTESQSLYLELLRYRRSCGDKIQIAGSLVGAGRVAAELGDYTAARAYLEECLELRRELRDRRDVSMALYDLAYVAKKSGDYTRVRTLYEECLTIRRELGDRRGVALAYYELGNAASRQHDFPAALEYFGAGQTLFGELGGDLQHVAMCLEGIARILMIGGESRRAVQLWGTAGSLREWTGTPIDLVNRAEHDANLDRAREALGEVEFNLAWSEGRALGSNHHSARLLR